jgi:cytochrome c oxidase subunit 2
MTRRIASSLVLAALLALVPCAHPLASEGDAARETPAPQTPRVVEITARRFQFAPGVVILRKGEPVTLRLHSEDVVHGFYLKELGIDAIIEPGKVTDVVVTPAATGRFTVICHHFCGSGHGGMKLALEVQ